MRGKVSTESRRLLRRIEIVKLLMMVARWGGKYIFYQDLFLSTKICYTSVKVFLLLFLSFLIFFGILEARWLACPMWKTRKGLIIGRYSFLSCQGQERFVAYCTYYQMLPSYAKMLLRCWKWMCNSGSS